MKLFFDRNTSTTLCQIGWNGYYCTSNLVTQSIFFKFRKFIK